MPEMSRGVDGPRISQNIQAIHHVSLPVSDLERSVLFYSEILGLKQIDRPPFDFPGAWFQMGSNQLHLIKSDHPTFREGKGVDARDIHFAIRVGSFHDALFALKEKGYKELGTDEETSDEFKSMRVNPRSTAGFPQIYILDPDRNIIEINAAVLDLDDVNL